MHIYIYIYLYMPIYLKPLGLEIQKMCLKVAMVSMLLALLPLCRAVRGRESGYVAPADGRRGHRLQSRRADGRHNCRSRGLEYDNRAED